MDHLLYTVQKKGLVIRYQQLQKYFITESPHMEGPLYIKDKNTINVNNRFSIYFVKVYTNKKYY